MTSILSRRSSLMAHSKITKLLPEIGYSSEDQLFYLEDGYLGFALKMTPLSGADESTLDQLSGVLSQDWPKGSFLQMNLFSSPDIYHVLNQMMAGRDEKNPTIYRFSEERAKFCVEGTKKPLAYENNALVRDHVIVLTGKIPCGNPPTEKDMKRTIKLASAIKSALESISFRPEMMTGATYVRFMQTIFNWGDNAEWRRTSLDKTYDPRIFVRDQYIDSTTDIEVSADHLRFGEKYVKTLSVKNWPDYASLGIPANYIADVKTGQRGLKGTFMITATIHFPDPESLRQKMTGRRQWVINQASGPMLKFIPRLKSHYDSYNALFEALDDDDRGVEFNLTLTLFEDSEDELVSATSNAKTYLRSIKMAMMEDRFFNMPIFLNALPFGADPEAMISLGRYSTMATRHAIRFLPFIGDWKGHGSPLMLMMSRSGQLMTIDNFASSTNYNVVVAAESGAGKSVLSNELICNILGVGGRVWMIDVGRSYEKLCAELGGKFVVFDEDSQICLNPFDLIKDYDDEADMLVGLIEAMAAPTEGLDDFQMAQLRRIMQELWREHGNDLTIDKLAARLIHEGRANLDKETSEEKRISDIGYQLFAFTSRGEYGKWFNGKNNLDIDNRFVVLELEELKSKEHLQQVVLLLLIYKVQQEMYLGDMNTRKQLMIDEAWSLLSSGAVAKFIEGGYRRFRKYNGAAMVITQGINDLYTNEAGRAIAENSANKWLLSQETQAIDSVAKEKRLPLKEAGYELLKTVHTQKGLYSEIFFLSKAGAGIGRLIISRFQQLLYTTMATEKMAIKRYQDQGYSLVDAIERVIADERAQKVDARKAS
ncbi:type IV secretion system protein TraC [Marinobacter sp. P4B1]|uniref:type IV secretion system protein TraC n=1 Tax=Marinobacter sp. P4B1 TaxID=1119533 RepID=UPI00071D1143|nr:type IV secretion system protein TraC [Marinobacter sp. P4B1]KRW83741.1 hypothetical protein AQ621_16970 [Marinobacter sp. P4B1]